MPHSIYLTNLRPACTNVESVLDLRPPARFENALAPALPNLGACAVGHKRSTCIGVQWM